LLALPISRPRWEFPVNSVIQRYLKPHKKYWPPHDTTARWSPWDPVRQNSTFTQNWELTCSFAAMTSPACGRVSNLFSGRPNRRLKKHKIIRTNSAQPFQEHSHGASDLKANRFESLPAVFWHHDVWKTCRTAGSHKDDRCLPRRGYQFLRHCQHVSVGHCGGDAWPRIEGSPRKSGTG